ncbi:MAG: hypothetical protein PHX18_06065 [Candidatus Gastranaerophilales bacterium]|nr:hypothetical protein [Candidatus Gastranaerophilales bacterium]
MRINSTNSNCNSYCISKGNLYLKQNSSFKADPFAQFQYNQRVATIVPIASVAPVASFPVNMAVPVAAADSGLGLGTLIGGLAAAGGIFALIIKFIRGRGGNPPIDAGIKLLKGQYQKIIQNFPSDKVYYEQLAKDTGLAAGEEFKLTSVVGKAQLSDLLGKFSPQDFKVGENLEGVRDLTYRVNLHNHTQASDGKLSVFDFLEQARKWADKIAGKVKDDKPPFTIAITDHDTLDGAKEAVRIIAQNPEKYKNLRVVLGSEISVSHIDPNDVVRPVEFELMGYALNPFNSKLNGLLKQVGENRESAIAQLLTKIKAQFPEYNIGFENSKSFHSNLKNVRTNGVLYLAGDYAKFKIMFSNYIGLINSKILPDGQQKLDKEKLFSELSDSYYCWMDATGNKDIVTFLKDYGIKKILSDRNLLTAQNQSVYEEIFKKDFKQYSDFISNEVKEALPAIADTKGYALLPKQVFEAIRQSDGQGFFGFAHPALIKLNSDNGSNISPARLKSLQSWEDKNKNLVYRVFQSLKQEGKDLFDASEINYQSYGKEIGNDWIKFMKEDIADCNSLKLKYTGGVDCHKPSIFLKHKLLAKDDIERLNLRELLGENYESYAALFKFV